jgi:hypothetical protein
MADKNLYIPEELEQAIKDHPDWAVGQTLRVSHEDCSKGKANPNAMAIIKKSDGYWFHCFRCQEFQGFVGDRKKTITEMKAQLASLKNFEIYAEFNTLGLPLDAQAMGRTRRHDLPWLAYQWGWNCDIDGSTIEKYDFHWSPSYNRVIIPIYEWTSKGKVLLKKLIGWVGREVDCRSKEQREKENIAKYITRKSSEYNRIFFHAPCINSDTYVLVEDILSAIKVREVCNVNAIALLTTSIPTKLLIKLKGKRVLIWLDFDQLPATMRYFALAKQWGINCKYLHTKKDPKNYDATQLNTYVNGKKIKKNGERVYDWYCSNCDLTHTQDQLIHSVRPNSCPMCHLVCKPLEEKKKCVKCLLTLRPNELINGVCPSCGDEVVSEEQLPADYYCRGCGNIVMEEELRHNDDRCPVCFYALTDSDKFAS